MPQQYEQFIEDHGISLKEKLGTLDWALKKEDALVAAKILHSASIPILGGEIITEMNGKFRHLGEGWHSDQQKDETLDDFVQKSFTETVDYITKSSEDNSGNYYYILVPGPKPQHILRHVVTENKKWGIGGETE
jgi:hypothetical protein